MIKDDLLREYFISEGLEQFNKNLRNTMFF